LELLLLGISFLQVGKIQYLSSKIWQTLGVDLDLSSKLCQTVGYELDISFQKLAKCKICQIWQTLRDEHLQEFVKFYLANFVFCQLLKRYAK
jgi:hypothetical protein